MSKIIIREYIPQKNQEDRDGLLDAYLSIWNHPDNFKFLSFTLKPFEEHSVNRFFSGHVDMGIHYYAAGNKNKEKYGIAVVGANPVIGFEIIGLGVQADLKNKGIGTQLLKYVLKVAEDSDFMAVDTVVFADNIPMLRLLLSMGFIPVNMRHSIRADGGDSLRMRKSL